MDTKHGYESLCPHCKGSGAVLVGENEYATCPCSFIINTMTPIEKELINEIEQLVLHAEEDSLTYSVLEHARKLVFKYTHPKDYAKYTDQNVLPDMRKDS